ncbi:MAG: N-acetyl-gamma-glutamyl-phosphate reductase [Caldilineaceae bacterium]|nr:N-acetyl-gamma-glutamyl-phosphate reductase [Caldilineaceae bacterium]
MNGEAKRSQKVSSEDVGKASPISRTTVSILGASGYAGGELLRLLLDHPHVEIAQVTSERNAGSFVHFTHPNLRGRTRLKFVSASELEPCDLLVLGLPHGGAMGRIDEFAGLADRIVDLSADFRLGNVQAYLDWYGKDHSAPDWLGRFVYGLPELFRRQICGAHYVSGVGCNATASVLAVWPLFAAGLADPQRDLICEVKVGSSEGGNRSGDATHHPERARAMRSFAPTGHRHTSEVLQALAEADAEDYSGVAAHMSATAVDNVRGVLATAHVFVRDGVSERDLWRAYRQTYRDEPFVRIVKEKTGIYRYPEPKILSGSNYADVGFELDERTGRVVALCAIDNLVKGAAGSALQSMNLMCGWEEATGLGFAGLHPV